MMEYAYMILYASPIDDDMYLVVCGQSLVLGSIIIINVVVSQSLNIDEFTLRL